MKRRFLAAILALAMTAACMTACSEDTNTEDEKQTTTTSAQTTTAESKAESGSSVNESKTESSSSVSESKTESKADTSSESSADSKTESSSETDSSQAEKKREEKEELLKVEYFKPSGELIYSQTREYVKDKNGEIWFLKATITGDPEKSKARPKRSASRYEYDADFKHEKYYNDKNELSSEAFYNDNGYTVKELLYSKGRVDEVYLYEYDSDGNTIKETKYYGTEDKYSSVTVTKYSYKGGKIISEYAETKDRDGHTDTTKKTYKYNSSGKIISEDTKIKRSNGITGTFNRTYKYDSKGNEIKMIESYSDGKKAVITKKYDDHNNCIYRKNETIENGKAEKSIVDGRFKYTYDGDNYVKVSLLETQISSGDFYPVTKETYKGDKIIEEVIYSLGEAWKGKYEVPEEIIKYTYGKV